MQYIRLSAILPLVLGIFVVFSGPAQAQSQIAQKIGDKILGSIIREIFHLGSSSIFGGPDAATPADVSRIVSEELGNYRIGTINASASGLASQIRVYSPSKTLERRIAAIDEIIRATGDLQGSVQQAIEHEGKFWAGFPNYIYATNVRLAFLAEDVTVSQESAKADAKVTVATEALHAIKKVVDFWRYDFVDDRPIQCLQRLDKKTFFFDARGGYVPDERTHGGNTVCVTDLWYRANNKRGTPNQHMIKDRRVFKLPGNRAWLFNYKISATDDGGGGYALSSFYASAAEAEAARILLSFEKYPSRLGDDYISSIKLWLGIVEASKDAALISDAKHYLSHLGL